jgi:hypothetical protein
MSITKNATLDGSNAEASFSVIRVTTAFTNFLVRIPCRRTRTRRRRQCVVTRLPGCKRNPVCILSQVASAVGSPASPQAPSTSRRTRCRPTWPRGRALNQRADSASRQLSLENPAADIAVTIGAGQT